MTLQQALLLQKGDIVTNKYTPISHEPIPVTDVWINNKRSIVLLRLHKVAKERWLDATGYELPESGKIWCDIHNRWEWSADHRRDHPEYYHKSKGLQRKPKRDRGAR
jgi:hypothetical protein